MVRISPASETISSLSVRAVFHLGSGVLTMVVHYFLSGGAGESPPRSPAAFLWLHRNRHIEADVLMESKSMPGKNSIQTRRGSGGGGWRRAAQRHVDQSITGLSIGGRAASNAACLLVLMGLF